MVRLETLYIFLEEKAALGSSLVDLKMDLCEIIGKAVF